MLQNKRHKQKIFFDFEHEVQIYILKIKSKIKQNVGINRRFGPFHCLLSIRIIIYELSVIKINNNLLFYLHHFFFFVYIPF